LKLANSRDTVGARCGVLFNVADFPEETKEMSVARELRALFSAEQLQELDAVSSAMRRDPEVLDNHRRPSAGEPEQQEKVNA
jgi:hypothetical protein